MNINELAQEIHKNAVEHGWWERNRDFPEIAALIHSEVSEAVEEWRNGKPLLYFRVETEQADGTVVPECRTDDGDGDYQRRGLKPEGIAAELADAVIRILDYAAAVGIDIDEVIMAKHAYNKDRPYQHGGKRG